MIDMRDPRGIITFIVRYLALQLGLLVLLVFSFSSGFVLLTVICLMGFSWRGLGFSDRLF